MCGRFTRLYTWKTLHELLDLRYPLPEDMRPSWNVAPAQTTPVCRLNAQGEREVVVMRWGFTPHWSKEPAPGPINARGETVATNGMFRAAYQSRRCLVPISGFYEWRKTDGHKQPFYLRLINDDAFCLAGIWDRWGGPGNDATVSFAIITTTPNELVTAIHDRMPVIVRRQNYDAWLASSGPSDSMLRTFPAAEMEAFPVSTRVNNTRNNDADLCVRADAAGGLFDSRA